MAANYEVRNVKLSVVDHDHSTYSRQLVNKIKSSGYFLLTGYGTSYDEALKQVEVDKADIVLEIPADFEKNIVRGNTAGLFLAVNAINGVKAGIGSPYLNTIIRDYNQEIRLQWIQMPRFS